jgi:hypothetical protein
LSFDIVKVISEKRELEQYTDPDRLQKEAVPYIGQAKQVSSSPGKVFLRLDSISSHGQMLEFNSSDIVFAEDVNTLTQKDGTAIQIIRLWVRKGSVGIRLEPFSVNDYAGIFSDRFNR